VTARVWRDDRLRFVSLERSATGSVLNRPLFLLCQCPLHLNRKKKFYVVCFDEFVVRTYDCCAASERALLGDEVAMASEAELLVNCHRNWFMPCVNPSTTVRGCSSRLSPIKGDNTLEGTLTLC
jgi:hypothetical protein